VNDGRVTQLFWRTELFEISWVRNLSDVFVSRCFEKSACLSNMSVSSVSVQSPFHTLVLSYAVSSTHDLCMFDYHWQHALITPVVIAKLCCLKHTRIRALTEMFFSGLGLMVCCCLSSLLYAWQRTKCCANKQRTTKKECSKFDVVSNIKDLCVAIQSVRLKIADKILHT
jgi:hypothetical protein